jgi:hypothetical protein
MRRHLIWNLHHDSFCPFTTRQDFSCGYILLKLRCVTTQIRPILWVFIDGPQHIKSLEPMVEVLYQQVKECFHEGVVCEWPENLVLNPTAYNCHNKSHDQPYSVNFKPGNFRVGSLIGSTSNDLPAAYLVTGFATHSSMRGCWIGGEACKGSTNKPRRAIIGKGKTKSGVIAIEKGNDHEDDHDDAEDNAHWHVTHFGDIEDMRNQCGKWQHFPASKVDKIGTQGIKSQREVYAKDLGWRERHTLPRPLHGFTYELFNTCITHIQTCLHTCNMSIPMHDNTHMEK